MGRLVVLLLAEHALQKGKESVRRGGWTTENAAWENSALWRAGGWAGEWQIQQPIKAVRACA